MRATAIFPALAICACAGIDLDTVRAHGAFAARLVLKDAIDDRCRDAGVKACAEITEGILLYVENRPIDGREHLRIAAGANTPAALKAFAHAIAGLGDVPGAASCMGPLLEAARFLDSGPALAVAEESERTPTAVPASALQIESLPVAVGGEVAHRSWAPDVAGWGVALGLAGGGAALALGSGCEGVPACQYGDSHAYDSQRSQHSLGLTLFTVGGLLGVGMLLYELITPPHDQLSRR
jgi:hypothetical protein